MVSQQLVVSVCWTAHLLACAVGAKLVVFTMRVGIAASSLGGAVIKSCTDWTAAIGWDDLISAGETRTVLGSTKIDMLEHIMLMVACSLVTD